MIESVVFSSKTQKRIALPVEIQNNKLILSKALFATESLATFDITITFKNAVSEFRNHDYTWVQCNQECIAGAYAAKAIKLADGTMVQPNLNCGFWEINKNNPKALLWRFNPNDAHPLTIYTGSHYERILANASQSFDYKTDLALLFTTQEVIEFSRSAIPFSAVACFTDHCDFDTLESLQLQRAFFKANNIKVTKGFFLNQFSKRDDNASVEFHKEEFVKWLQDGHELGYHSLSQSLKRDTDSFKDFFSFTPPFATCPTWIDHGYQPYNLSLYQNKAIDETVFSNNLKQKGITTLWNYIDTGTSSLGVINQLNPKDFTLKSFYNGIKNLSFKSKLGILIKNIMFHYYADEKLIMKYKSTAESFKQLVYQKKLNRIFCLIANAINLSIPILKVFLFWNSHKNKPYKLAKYSPLLFKHQIAGNEFYVFQTLEMVDFKKSLHPKNIDKLIAEKGVFIAHTYFAVPMEYHEGRIFKNAQTIEVTVSENFQYLSKKIRENELWNPTLNELVEFLTKFEQTILDINPDGKITVLESAGLPYRLIR